MDPFRVLGRYRFKDRSGASVPNWSGYQRSNGVDQQQGQALATLATTDTASSAITEALSRYDIALSIAQAAPSV